MSRIEFHTGKLRKIEQQPEVFAKQFLWKKRDFYETFLEHLLSEQYKNFVLLAGDLYEFVEHEENQDSETYFCKFYEDSNGELNFITNFYNGGTCLSEMLKDGFKQYQLNQEPYIE